jgi:hypothetical protein
MRGRLRLPPIPFRTSLAVGEASKGDSSVPKQRYGFAANQYESGWITSSQLFDTPEEAAQAASKFMLVCLENAVPCDVRLLVNRSSEVEG